MTDKCKSLKEMSLEELWALFPVTLTPHKSVWKAWAKDEMDILDKLLCSCSPVISHIGSTAIPRIHAKPIVDILVEISIDAEFPVVKRVLEASGYICMSESETRMSFNKGYTPSGYADKVFHIHIHRAGDNDEILFRDYLVRHPDVAEDYERLKLSLLPEFKNDRDGYTMAKSEFVSRIVRQAKGKHINH